MKKCAIIVAGGSGERMGASTPKQFLLINGKPVLMHTIEKFCAYDSEVKLVIVLPEKQTGRWEQLKQQHGFAVPHTVVNGGESRFHSVKNGLTAIKYECVVLIHDGVRPLVSHQTIHRCYETAKKHGTAIPVLPVKESLRKLQENKNKAVDRDTYVNVQTPQAFTSSIIQKAYEQEYQPWFTDDASVVESAGYEIALTEGNYENIKLTHPDDIKIAEALLG